MRGHFYVPILLLALLPNLLYADTFIRVAVASNFAATARELSSHFTSESGTEVRLSFGSTGKLYAQIVNGAPFDIFLAADTERPMLLEGSGHGVAGMRFNYATGALVLWSADPDLSGRDCREALLNCDFRRIALGNPITVPYGRAARDVLAHLELMEVAQQRLVFGESIAQVLQFTATGNATLGFIARSQTLQPELPVATCSWPVPESMHGPINQQLILLSRAADNAAARDFLVFMRSATAREIMTANGYGASR